MRRLNILITALLLGLFLTNALPSKAQDDYYDATYQDFYDDLSPYGQWIYDNQYGYIWLPDVGPDFRPYYSNGYWAMTQYGNTWISGYDWGWAAFHYGRWTYDSYYGWLWIPDTQWGPAWVSWRSNNDYYGWAPMGPGVNINVNLGLIPVDWWVFLSPTYFYSPSFHSYCNNDYRFRRNLYGRTTIINYTYVDNRSKWYTGPRANDYYKTTGRRPSMFSVTNNRRAGAMSINGNRLNMYRPSMRKGSQDAPQQIARTDRAVTRRPQTFSGTASQATGRDVVLRQRSTDNNINRNRMYNSNATPDRAVAPTQRSNIQAPQRDASLQQRDAQIQQQRVQQQRDVEVRQQRDAQTQQQRMQQQRDMEARQQRDAQIQQQRVQQQRDVEMRQQRDAQMQQQRMQQQRDVEVRQQRDAQAQQQRMQQQRDMEARQQRDAQMQQQRMQQQRDMEARQQRDAQVQQQRMQQQQRDAQMQQQREMQMRQRSMQAPQQSIQERRDNNPPSQPMNNPQQGRMRGR